VRSFLGLDVACIHWTAPAAISGPTKVAADATLDRAVYAGRVRSTAGSGTRENRGSSSATRAPSSPDRVAVLTLIPAWFVRGRAR